MSAAAAKVAIVTGAGRGIGQATAIRLSAAGSRCALVSRSANELEETRSRCTTDAIVLPADVREASQINQVVADVLARWSRIDVLVNNAGYAKLLPFEQMTAEIWRDTIEINLSATFHFTHAVWPAMSKQKSGVIVNVSSESARDPFQGFAAYGAAKAGVNLLTKALAKEGDPLGIRIHAVAPAGVETGMLRAFVSQQDFSPDLTLAPEAVADAIYSCIAGDLAITSGETIYVHRRVG
jgi:3-oxoacyl-[acyl-carrier protein] reductase